MPIWFWCPRGPSPHDLRAVGATVDIAERHGKPVVFVINAATARARITGRVRRGPVAAWHGGASHHPSPAGFCGQHDRRAHGGRGGCPIRSAKEISDLWLYIQERLSRIVHDPALLPQVKPNHLAINSLLAE